MAYQIAKLLTAEEETKAAKAFLPKYILLHRGLGHALRGGQNRYYTERNEHVHLEYADDVAERDQADADFALKAYRQAEAETARQAEETARLAAEQFAHNEQLRQQTATATTEQLLAALYRQSPQLAEELKAKMDAIAAKREDAAAVIAAKMGEIEGYDKALDDLKKLVPAKKNSRRKA
ncbi:TPA: hypothetical protein DIU27_04695 [Candidatus Collierbacteria bacterium]|uniref:Uncharacterized protein n=1 Tax=Candidatus Collierbacteria bacterium GW2011_GWB2_44_22 TaxID=1618387 RepID=A0A0G1K612_9BACT|nr:MAG: hypothetical protein UW31_C0016G0023 [Candidatus Collierbacteria bacterium GW2011_GWA2_44_13]KKT51762.1 MAG: hypothetical protein UW44_C0008G0084 [Candidatus Collierbacteria bacterium GW2011_GWB2_44_22]KKT65483.1 MAG: hypothetical protein UW58_C0029G0023 [Candidatus Collierbacteria bacterium GW2011_GWC2_44_30]KKT68298.1 MAG: hypothetical protein UW64_C0023G0014 [Microgenomates group bacterium GW2011_GWC1_44_37]KKT87987.1 MAG: hypothetical protein UW88_C0017G0008 [Candidatus Collierbacte